MSSRPLKPGDKLNSSVKVTWEQLGGFKPPHLHSTSIPNGTPPRPASLLKYVALWASVSPANTGTLMRSQQKKETQTVRTERKQRLMGNNTMNTFICRTQCRKKNLASEAGAEGIGLWVCTSEEEVAWQPQPLLGYFVGFKLGRPSCRKLHLLTLSEYSAKTKHPWHS